jgi:hypothetical protein
MRCNAKQDPIGFFWLTYSVIATVVLGCVFSHSLFANSVSRECVGADPGDYCATSEIVVFPGEYVYENRPGCDKSVGTIFASVAQTYGRSTRTQASEYAGSLNNQNLVQLDRSTHLSGGDLNLLGREGRVANCALLAIAIPRNAILKGANVEAAEERGSEWHACSLSEDCPIGWSSFDKVLQQDTPNGIVIAVPFKNWSHNRARRARLTVYFTPPSAGWTPPLPVSPAN